MMALVKSTDKVQVFDDFLPEDQFQEIWKFVQAQSYISPQTSGEWLKIWRLSDGHPLIGTLIWCLSQRPLNNPFDYLLEPVVELAGQNASIRDWQDVSCRVFLYPRGTKLSWHNDAGNYAGAFTFYVHPRWGSTWGGELLVAEVPPLNQVFSATPTPPHLNHEWEDDYLSIRGVGQYITPKPNRLVLMAPGVFHGINRVDADAGDNVRCSVQGVFIKESKSSGAK